MIMVNIILHFTIIKNQADSKFRALSASFRLKKPDRNFDELKNYSNDVQTHINTILKTRAVSGTCLIMIRIYLH